MTTNDPFLSSEQSAIGICPFCCAPIPRPEYGPPCPHFAGADDPAGRLAPRYPIVQGLSFTQFFNYVDAIADFPPESRAYILGRLTPGARRLFATALEEPVMAAFWKPFVPHRARTKEVPVDGVATTVVTYFVRDLAEARMELAARVDQALAELV